MSVASNLSMVAEHRRLRWRPPDRRGESKVVSDLIVEPHAFGIRPAMHYALAHRMEYRLGVIVRRFRLFEVYPTRDAAHKRRGTTDGHR